MLIKIFKGSSKDSSKYYIFPLFKTLADEDEEFQMAKRGAGIVYSYEGHYVKAIEQFEDALSLVEIEQQNDYKDKQGPALPNTCEPWH